MQMPTDEGFLKNSDDWTIEFANMLAQKENIQLTQAHWEVIYFARAFYAKYAYSPIQRLIVKQLKEKHPEASSLYLQELFPKGPRQICLLAGLPKPARCV